MGYVWSLLNDLRMKTCIHLPHYVTSTKLANASLAQKRSKMISRGASRRIRLQNRNQRPTKHMHTSTALYYIGQAHKYQPGPKSAQNDISRSLTSDPTPKSESVPQKIHMWSRLIKKIPKYTHYRGKTRHIDGTTMTTTTATATTKLNFNVCNVEILRRELLFNCQINQEVTSNFFIFVYILFSFRPDDECREFWISDNEANELDPNLHSWKQEDNSSWRRLVGVCYIKRNRPEP